MIAVNGSHIKDVRLSNIAVQKALLNGTKIWSRERTGLSLSSMALGNNIGGINRCAASSLSVGDNLYVIAGINQLDGNVRLKDGYAKNLISGTITPVQDLPIAMYSSTLVEAEGRLFLCGGLDYGYLYYKGIYELNLSNNTWSTRVGQDGQNSDKTSPRGALLAGYGGNNHIYLFGGEISSSGILSAVAKYNISTNTYSKLPSLPFTITKTGNHSFLIDGSLYFLGRTTDAFYIVQFDIETETASIKITLPTSSINFGEAMTVMLDGYMYIISAYSDNKIRRYDHKKNQLLEIGTSDLTPNHRCSADNKFYNNTLHVTAGVYNIGGVSTNINQSSLLTIK